MKTLKPLLAAAACALLPLAASAQAPFPAKPVTIIVPNAPGGAIDILARLLEKNLSDTWKQPVIVQYKPGAGTVMGTDFVVRSARSAAVVAWRIAPSCVLQSCSG